MFSLPPSLPLSLVCPIDSVQDSAEGDFDDGILFEPIVFSEEDVLEMLSPVGMEMKRRVVARGAPACVGLHTPQIDLSSFPPMRGVRLQRHANRWQCWFPGAHDPSSKSYAFGDGPRCHGPEEAVLELLANWCWEWYHTLDLDACMQDVVQVCAI